jgi:predicted ABC-type ATPase
MPQPKPTLYIIAGCNGAGKTTFAKVFLPEEVKCLRFLNADEIARGLSPLAPQRGTLRAVRILLGEIHASLKRRETFALESTLAGKSHITLLRHALRAGYETELHYLRLDTPQQAIARVQQRVLTGGHDVPEADIIRRFYRSRQYLLAHYLQLATRWVIWDSSKIPSKQLASSLTASLDSLQKLLEYENQDP